MATVAFTAFLPQVMPHVMGCPRIMAVDAIRNSCIDFCNRTMWWQETPANIAVTALTLPYALSAINANAIVTKIMSAHVSGQPLGPTTMEELDNRVWDWRSRTGAPQNYYQPDLAHLAVYPIPDGTDSYTVTLRVAYAPIRTATTVDDSLYSRWMEAVAAGALMKLMAMPGKSWSSADGSMYYRTMFNQATTEAAIEANRSYTRGATHIQMRAF